MNDTKDRNRDAIEFPIRPLRLRRPSYLLKRHLGTLWSKTFAVGHFGHYLPNLYTHPGLAQRNIHSRGGARLWRWGPLVGSWER